jgi:hypothetical protein
MYAHTRHAAPFSTPAARPRVERAALRTRSEALRDVIARRASRDRLDYRGLVDQVRSRSFVADQRMAGWLGSLARVVALQSLDPRDLPDALAIFRAMPERHLDASAALTYAQLLLELGHFEELHDRAAALSALSPDAEFPCIGLLNAAGRSPYADPREWANSMTAALARRGLDGLHIGATGELSLFDSVDAESPAEIDGPLVSVVMTTFDPTERLITSLRSVLQQSWRNLEVIVVDDASGPAAAEWLDAARALDERVRVVSLERNGGTYRARNAALAVARGQYVTGHDDDDWAHPHRIERQIAALEGTPGAAATLSRAVWASDDFQVATLGWPATGRYAPSFLTRLDTVRKAGPYLPARKGADTELIRRIEAMTGAATVELGEPLNLYRTRTGSLSREDFAPGWDHPARVSFWRRSQVVHDDIRAGKCTAPEATDRIVVPRRFRDPSETAPYDVLLLADWRGPVQGPVGHYLTEALALRESGLRVGIVQLEDLRRTGERAAQIDPLLVRHLNHGDFDEVFLDEDVEASALIVRDAGVLSYADDRRTRLRVGRLALVVDGVPLESAPVRGTFALTEVLARAERMFGSQAVVIGADLAARQAVRSVLPEHDVRAADTPYRGVADRRLRSIARPPRITGTPVVGVVVEHPFGIPEAATIGSLFPEDVDARALVLTGSPIDDLPGDCLTYTPDDISLLDFLAQIDILVDFSTRAVPRPTVLAAMAAGCVVVSRAEHRPALGEAAVYVRPVDAAAFYSWLRRDPDAYARQVGRARSFAASHLGAKTWRRRLSEVGLISDGRVK